MSEGHQRNAVFGVFTEIAIINQLSQTAMERALPDRLRMAHFGVLNHFIRCGKPESPTRLANAFQVTKAAMTNTLNRLSTRGLVSVMDDPTDGRAKIVSITDAGKAIHERALTAITPLAEKMLTALQPTEFAAALPFLIRLRETLDAARD